MPALTFTDGSGGTFVTLGSAPSLDNLATMTMVAWINTTTIAPAATRVILSKGGGGIANNFALLSTGKLQYTRKYATTNANAEATLSGFVAANVWSFVAASNDGTLAPKLYAGSLTALVAEASYSTSVAPSGALGDESANVLYGGGSGIAAQGFPGSIALWAIWNRVLMLAELQEFQRCTRLDLNYSHLLGGCVGLWLPGRYPPGGTPQVPDLSGQGNHGTINTATLLLDTAPLHIADPFRPPLWVPYRVAAAPATSGAVVMAVGGRLAAVGAKASTNTANERAEARAAAVSAKGGLAAEVLRALGHLAAPGVQGGLAVGSYRALARFASATVKSGLATAVLRSAGRLTSAGAHAGASAAELRTTGRLEAESTPPAAVNQPFTIGLSFVGSDDVLGGSGALSVPATTGAAVTRAFGFGAAVAMKAATNAASVRAAGRYAPVAAKGGLAVGVLRAIGRLALVGTKASTAAASEQAPARLEALVTSARTAVAVLRALARQVASSVPNFAQDALLSGRAWMAASGTKGATAAAVQAGLIRQAAAGVKTATGQARLSASGRIATTARRDAFAAVVLRAYPRLAAVGVVDRAGAAAIYVRGRGAVLVTAPVVAGERGTVTASVGLVYAADAGAAAVGRASGGAAGAGGVEAEVV